MYNTKRKQEKEVKRKKLVKEKLKKMNELKEKYKKHPPVWYTYHCYKPETDKDRKDIEDMFKSMNLSYLYNKKTDDYKALIAGTLGMPTKTIKRQSDNAEIGKVYPTTKEEFEIFKNIYANAKGEIEQERKEDSYEPSHRQEQKKEE